MSPHAAFWALCYVAIVVLPLLVLLFGGERPPGRGFWWDLSMGLGFAGVAMMAAQFALTARFRRATQPFGVDILYYFHRILAIGALAIVLGHFAILYIRYHDALGELNPLTARWELTAGRAALGCFALLVVTSEFRKRLRLEYGLWRYLHVGLAVTGFAAAVGHIGGVGYYTDTPAKQTLWLAVTLGFLGLIAWTRLAKPLRQLGEPWRIAQNRPERGGAYTLALEPVGHAGLGAWAPGQFAWLTLRSSPLALREHPFTIASPPEAGPRLEFGIKPQGDFTGLAQSAEPGETVYLDGPYGVFSIDHYPDAPGFVFIAGGIGITPMLANLSAMAERSDPRPATLFYCNPAWDDVPYRDALAALAERMRLDIVHVLEHPPEGWEGESGRLTRDIIERHLPEGLAARMHFLCGPTPLTNAARGALTALGVPGQRIESELFELV
ncbi:ferredoxin reductase family protein [soil metagenome]